MSSTKNTSGQNSLNYPLNIDEEYIDKDIMKPFTYLTTVPGKQLRNNLLIVLGHWVTVPDDTLAKLDKIVYLIHNATLLLDDIQDSSMLRRGVPAVHKVYGIPRTLLAANWAQTKICDLVEELDNLELTQLYTKKVLEICAGQGMELYWRDNYICPTEEEYLQMIHRKSGLLFVLIEGAMNAFCVGKQVDARKLMTAFGMYFQINDDYQNLHNQVYFDSKGFCEDITEGKFSYPIVHAVNNFPKEGEIIMDILRERTYDVELKRRCLSILEECGSFEYTKKKIQELRSCLHDEISKLGENPLMEEYIETVAFSIL